MPVGGKCKSVLLTPDPYHTPGYGGFCPQFQYQIGETFGRTTSRLLTDHNVASSGRRVLADIKIDPKRCATTMDEGTQSQRTRQRSLGDQKLMDNMIPGYSGYIPKSLNYFGTRFTEICRESVSEFEDAYQSQDAKLANLRTSANQIGLTRIISKDCPPDSSVSVIERSERPALTVLACHVANNLKPFNQNTDPNKKFMSGYQGFVPRSRGLMGLGFPIITNKALITFTEEVSKHRQLKNQPILVKRELKSARDPSKKQIYTVGVGMIPDYTGHIPGQKFRYGQTFGTSTENAKCSPPCV
ncbi:protein FAM166B-like [Gigantopelta aegis]|uniref:protein FAM166B-like n=1 Tax=Gigantopelta aegis TaxID=1735272 RepID=UPI001B889AA0|nr:protein FAM166B-like [Gigantopelta aegis]